MACRGEALELAEQGAKVVINDLGGSAKAGIAALTIITSLEGSRYGVRANAVAPGARPPHPRSTRRSSIHVTPA